MKLLIRLRYWLLCVVLVLVLGGLFYALNQRAATEGGAWQRASLAASIADEATTVLVHFPSINDTGRAFAEADLARLWQMSAVQELLAQPLSETPEMQALKPYWKQCLALKAKEAMLAVSLQGERPQVLMAFQSTENLSEVWQPACSWLRDKCEEEAKEIITEEGDVSYRIVGSGITQVVQARWRDWCLTGTEEIAVRQALGRLRSNTKLTSLANSETFVQAVQALPRDYLSLSYVDTGNVNDTEPATEVPETPAQPLIRHLKRLVHTATKAHLRAVALTSTIRDGKMVDQATVLADHKESTPIDPSEVTLNLTSPNTLAFFTAALGSEPMRQHVLAPYRERWLASDNKVLQTAAAEAATLFDASWSFQLEPIDRAVESDETGETMLLLAFALRDPAAGLAWLERLAEQDHSGVTRTGPDSFAFDVSFLTTPTAHLLTELHARIDHGLLHFADNARGLHQVLRRWQLDNLTSRDDFRKLARKLPKANAGLGFIDANRVLANSYDALRHPLVVGTLWMGLRSQTNLELDFSHLDAHGVPSDFTPTMISLSRTPGGFRQASVGSLSPSQWALGGGLAVALIDKTFLEPLPMEAEESFVAPEAEAELLRMIESD